MSSTLYVVMTFILIASSLHGVYVKYFKSAGLETDTWQDVNNLANELGLTFTENSLEDYNGGWLHGTYRDVTVSVQDEAIRHGRHGDSLTVTTMYEVYLGEEHIIEGLEVVREELFTKLSKAFGGEDIQIGHEQFDKAFIIRAHSEQDAQRLFENEDVRQNFLNLQKMCSNFHFKDGILTLEYPEGIFYKQNKIRGRIEALVNCAQAIMNHKKIPQQLSAQPPSAEQQVWPEPQEAVELENTTINW